MWYCLYLENPPVDKKINLISSFILNLMAAHQKMDNQTNICAKQLCVISRNT